MLEFAITPQSFILPPFTSSYLPPPPLPTFYFSPGKTVGRGSNDIQSTPRRHLLTG
jgi:hypothetical protein